MHLVFRRAFHLLETFTDHMELHDLYSESPFKPWQLKPGDTERAGTMVQRELLGVFLQTNQERQKRQRQKGKQKGIKVNL